MSANRARDHACDQTLDNQDGEKTPCGTALFRGFAAQVANAEKESGNVNGGKEEDQLHLLHDAEIHGL